MKAKTRVVMVTLVAGMLLVPVAFAESAKDIAEQCKKEAVDNEIPSDEIRMYVSECMSEHGVEAVDADKAINEMMPGDNNGQPPSSTD